ncbi:MAG: FixH family protein [Myxococcales bacterium]|nr:FixH family protein [Myxococcales bacterium]
MEPQSKPRTGWQWPVLIVLLLMIPVVGNLVLVMKATGDPSFVIEEDYYRKAVLWDQTMAQQEKNHQLRWALELTTKPGDTAYAPTTVSLVLKDAHGEPIRDASIRVEGFHNARAAHVAAATASETTDGFYQAQLDLRRSGLHEFNVHVVRGSDIFTYKTQKDVMVGPYREQP